MASNPISKSSRVISGRLVPSLLILFNAGCGDFFAQKPTEIETKTTINELRQLKENTNIKNPMPELYRQPPQKMAAANGVKLFYFTRQLPADKLGELVTAQFVKTPADTDKKDSKDAKYLVSPNNATNQLIVHCPNDADADRLQQFLEKVDVPPIQVNIDCIILERFADMTMDWETTLKIDNLFGEGITLGGKTDAAGNLLPAFPGASLREAQRANFGLDVGYWNKELSPHAFRTAVDVLVSRGYLKVLMNPNLETVNGQKATITARDYAPLPKIVSQPGYNQPFNLTDYQWVADTLEVTPHVFADGSISLETSVTLGSRSKPEGVAQTPIISENFIKIAENRIQPGHSLVVGGIRKSIERSVIRGVPFFKDIPLLGILFSSKDHEEVATEIIFILTPSVSSGGVEYQEMIEEIERKWAKPKYYGGLHETLTDPFGSSAYTERVEERAAKAELDRIKANTDKAQALDEMNQLKQELHKKADQITAERAKLEQLGAEALKAKEEAQKAKSEADQAKERGEAAASEAQKQKKDSQAADSGNTEKKQ